MLPFPASTTYMKLQQGFPNGVWQQELMNLNVLFQSAGGGDEKAEKRLFEQLSARFRLLARHRIWNGADAEEIAQEALMTVAREYRRVQITASFSAWAHKILDNRVLAYIQSAKRQAGRTEKLSEETENRGRPMSAEDGVLRRQLLDCFRQVAEPNRRYARILNLHYQGYGTEDICRRLSITPSNFYSILSRARALLRRCLEREEEHL